MLINNIDIKNFKAKLLDRDIGISSFNIKNEWLDKSFMPLIDSNVNYKYKSLSFTLDIICANSNEVETIKSNIIDTFNKSIMTNIKFDDIDYIYKGFIIGEPSSKYVSKGNETLNIKMLVFSELTEIIKTINRLTSKTILCEGNTVTPCIVEITPISDIIDITLEGLAEDPIIIKNIKANKKVILDGELQTVTVDGINKYGDTDMWDFPRLKPGNNLIKVSRNSCDITIKYKPRFI